MMKWLRTCRNVVALSVVAFFFHAVRGSISAIMYIQAFSHLRKSSRISLT
ncbi:hypothetical protein U14_04813 [Candidatus Moduliflexus flocculans]|uniref:Uncharacterized protein n=1 Tax=Candidatus Moduliflexus flocculans TaxID=1499966 RepID=A0A0S6W4W5_9BACT|nr:hypothetical protein U14_04813 [Candidatus Moduliflexus flocculans]